MGELVIVAVTKDKVGCKGYPWKSMYHTAVAKP